MRNSWYALLALLFVTLTSRAQTSTLPTQTPPATPPATVQPATPALDPTHNALDRHLIRWHDEMQKVQTLAMRCVRDDISKVYSTKDTFEGTIHFLKPNYVILQMQKKGKPEIFEKVISTGTYLYQFVPAQKEIRVYQALNPKSGQATDDNALSFLFGMKPEDAKRRYDLKLAKEDQHYIYVDINPKLPGDKAEFMKARVVLNKDNFLPRQLWFQQPNTDEVIWDIPVIQSGVKLEKKDFAAPTVPKDWKMVQGQAPTTETPPRVVRPTNR